MTSIKKRDGQVVEFDQSKIVNAVLKAMERTDLGKDDQLAKTIAEKVSHKIFGSNKVYEVEEIQDLVEKALMLSKRKDVAREYIIYRQRRTEERMKNSEVFKMGHTIVDESDMDILNENANLNGVSFSGKMSKFGSEYSKMYAKQFVMPKEVVRGIDDNYIYVHDLDQYALGTTNCIFIDFGKLLERGFSTGNGSVRKANSISTAMSLVAIIFQSQQNSQFGGVSGNKIDWDLAPYVDISFKKHFKKGVEYFGEHVDNDCFIFMGSEVLHKIAPKSFDYAMKETKRETYQAAEGLVHNLNTMSSRAGGQIPFTSLNYGTCTSPEGRLVVEALLEATINGLGNGETPIFPQQIFQCKKGINFNESDPNYDLFLKAVECSSKRMYPNFVNVDSTFNLPYYKENDPNTVIATMGCRTRTIGDRFGHNHCSGKGNLSFNTINLVKLGLDYGIVLGERDKADVSGFYDKLNELMEIALNGLIHRFNLQCKQPAKASDFMMREGVWEDGEKLDPNETVGELLKHGTLSIGFIGVAECMKAMFGKHHGEDQEVWDFAHDVISYMREYCDQKSEEYNLNISLFATPAEGLSGKFTKADKKHYGIIEGVTDREYYTNSYHVPVYYNISIKDKIDKEAPFHELCNAGHISYIELDGNVRNNQNAFLKIVKYAMNANMGYFAINHKIDGCPKCKYEGIIGFECPNCKVTEDQVVFNRLRRVTGYLTGNYLQRFNSSKKAETDQRVTHSYTFKQE